MPLPQNGSCCPLKVCVFPSIATISCNQVVTSSMITKAYQGYSPKLKKSKLKANKRRVYSTVDRLSTFYCAHIRIMWIINNWKLLVTHSCIEIHHAECLIHPSIFDQLFRIFARFYNFENTFQFHKWLQWLQ